MNWIKVEDQPPPKDKTFLGYVKVGFYCDGLKDDRTYDIQTCIWDRTFNDRFYEYCHCSGLERDEEYIEVTHWMPLPFPPEDL